MWETCRRGTLKTDILKSFRFQAFQEHQEFQEFQEIATHFKSVSRDSKRQQEFQEFQEHVSRVTNLARLNYLSDSLPDVAGKNVVQNVGQICPTIFKIVVKNCVKKLHHKLPRELSHKNMRQFRTTEALWGTPQVSLFFLFA